MFSWFISLLLLFGNHGEVAVWHPWDWTAQRTRHVAPSDNPEPGPQNPLNVDGKGSGGGGGPYS